MIDLIPLIREHTQVTLQERESTMNRNIRRISARRLVQLLGLVLAGCCFWLALDHAFQATKVQATTTPASPGLIQRRIDDLRVGQRVLAVNPERRDRSAAESEFDPVDWRLMRLVMDKPDGGRLEVELLRPRDWLAVHALELLIQEQGKLPPARPVIADARDARLYQALLGQTIHLDLPEMGAAGPALVEAILACPSIEAATHADRRVITGRFQHSAGNVIDLHIAGEPRLIGVTDNHPFWSEDRKAFVPAGELRTGERLRKVDQTLTKVVRITPRTGPPKPVYNLEIDGEHVYFVGASGVLAHNTYLTYIGIDVATGLPYVGRTSGTGTIEQIINRRINSHHRKLIDVDVESISESYAEIRGREQQLIDKFGLENLANEINGISERNPRLEYYLDAAFDAFGNP